MKSTIAHTHTHTYMNKIFIDKKKAISETTQWKLLKNNIF